MLPLVMALGKHSVRLQWHLVKLQVAALIDTFCPPHPANVLSCAVGSKLCSWRFWMGRFQRRF